MSDAGRKQWDELWQRLGVKNAGTLYSDLSARYAEPHRAYHNLTHILHCLEEFEAARDLARYPAAVELAIWYHDAVYDPRSKENESRSAKLASESLRGVGLPMDLNNRVTRLILATRSHDASTDPDAPVMVDVDLSILGQKPGRFDEYERQIRQEYDWVSEEAFAAGRASVLKSFMDRPTIYSMEFFQKKYEQQARSNLKGSLFKLESRTAQG
jgi:predicted metal-dependent HD superfamily phosphohydrolase